MARSFRNCQNLTLFGNIMDIWIQNLIVEFPCYHWFWITFDPDLQTDLGSVQGLVRGWPSETARDGLSIRFLQRHNIIQDFRLPKLFLNRPFVIARFGEE